MGGARRRRTRGSSAIAYATPRPRFVQDLGPQPNISKREAQGFVQRRESHFGRAAQVMPTRPTIAGLDDSYVIEDRATVSHFIEEHRLQGLLLAAKEPLNDAFTDRPIKILSLLRDDEGFETLFCLVMIPGEMEPARQALRRFDEQWWLAHSGQVAGKLNFDFELI